MTTLIKPHKVIGGAENPYMKRWHLIPKNRLLNIYLHQFLRSDDDRALHDHPWHFLSFILKGCYWEHREGREIPLFREAGSIALRKADTLHRVELFARDNHYPLVDDREELPCWTIVITGPKIREWGFQCPQGWRHWRVFDAKNGCGEE